ncbi:MAG: M20/M25/M40 family metallo-hydrolase, partial [Planctomycetes bacterium]|nr:M20/M25/M40 family metallo-hydrolase [Planctomycetota bacterium]
AIGLLRSLTEAAPKRLAGSPGADTAVQWALATMRELGLENVRAEPCLVPHWTRGTEQASIVSPAAAPLRITALGGSIATPPGGIEAEVVEVRTFEQLQQLGERARGKIVFFNRPMPRALRSVGQAYGEAVPQRSNGAIEAGKVGALAALVRSMTTAIDDHPHTGAMQYDPAVPQVPAAAVATVDAELLAAALKAGPVRVRLELGCAMGPDVPGANVVGELRGSERPDEIVLVGGHLDAWDLGTGAHDDGAGCVHCLEAARLLLATGLRPRRTVRVVLFANEENGLRGAKAYAAAHAGNLGKHVAALETDSGGFTPTGFQTSLRDHDAAAVQAAFAPLRELGAGLFLPGAGACGADISPLHAAGVPCFGLMVDGHKYFDYHHTAVDTLAMVNERELALGAAVVAFAAFTLADR